jgi:hypothetical protein
MGTRMRHHGCDAAAADVFMCTVRWHRAVFQRRSCPTRNQPFGQFMKPAVFEVSTRPRPQVDGNGQGRVLTRAGAIDAQAISYSLASASLRRAIMYSPTATALACFSWIASSPPMTPRDLMTISWIDVSSFMGR